MAKPVRALSLGVVAVVLVAWVASHRFTSTPSGDVSAQTMVAQAQGPATPTVERTPDVVFVPTPQPVVDRMLELAQVHKGDIVYDLGCGDGRIVVTAAKKFGVRAYGFDIDPKRVAESKENVRKNNVEHLVTIEQADIFTLDLSPASVVTLYLLPQLNVRLIPQLEKLHPGSRVVSHDFDMEGVTAVKVEAINPPVTDREHKIYLWHTPIRPSAASTTQPGARQQQ